MYKIKYYYQTGDSFHTEELERILEFEWKNLDIAKECLKRIQEHYKWYECMEHPHWYREEEITKPKWHNIKTSGHHKGHEHYMLNIPMDNGNEVQFWAPWCGYFERLYGAEIVTDGDTDMKFEL